MFSTLMIMIVIAINLVFSQQTVDHYWVFLCNSTKGAIGYAHMPMIEYIPSSNSNLLVSAWQEAKTTEGANDQHIAFSTSSDSGKTWSKPINIQDGGGYAVWGPVLHFDNMTNSLWLFFSQSAAFNNRSTNRNYPGGNIMHQQSSDLGKTWSKPIEILDYNQHGKVSKVTANPMIVLSMSNAQNSRWLLPFWQEPHGHDTGQGSASILISDDGGKTWNISTSEHNDKTWLIENTIALIYDGNVNTDYNQTVLQLFRTQTGFIYSSYSYDSGSTWTVAKEVKDLKNPNSKVMVFTDSNHEQILSYNPSSTERYPLDLAVSKDNSQTWSNYVVVGNEKKSQAYPTSVQMYNNVYTVYSDDTHTGIRLSVTAIPS